MPRDDEMTYIRIPKILKDAIEVARKRQKRTLTAEIVYRLEEYARYHGEIKEEPVGVR